MVSRSDSSAAIRQFRRRIVQQDDRTLIESTCRYCGKVIIGSVMDALTDDEAQHADQCRANPPAA